MSVRRLRVPTLLAATTLVLGACTGAEPPQDAGIDACPDPLACVLDFTRTADGGILVIYRRDGSASDVPCPERPPGCPVA
jgi:hypothetical protein